MKYILLIIFFITALSAGVFEELCVSPEDLSWSNQYGSNIIYFDNVRMYPVVGMEVPQYLTGVLFDGFSEAQLVIGIQEYFFYYLPKGQVQLASYRSGAVILKKLKEKRIHLYIIPAAQTVLILYYDSRGMIERKVTVLTGEILEVVDYFYHSDGRRQKVHSNLYGWYYYDDAETTLNKISRLFDEMKAYKGLTLSSRDEQISQTNSQSVTKPVFPH